MKTNTQTLYPPQNPEQLGVHFLRHMSAMTTEGLHMKSAIAEQLAWRDQQIETLEAELKSLRSSPSPAPDISATPTLLRAKLDAAELKIAMYEEERAVDARLASDFEKVAAAVVAKRGLEKQLLKAVEECGELASEIARFLDGTSTAGAVAEETADVLMLCQQLKHIFGRSRVNAALAKKMERTIERLDLKDLL